MAPKKTIAKKTPPKKTAAKKSPAKASSGKKATSDTNKKMLYEPAAGSDMDIRVRIKAVIAVLEDAPVSAAKAEGAAEILKGVLKLM